MHEVTLTALLLLAGCSEGVFSVEITNAPERVVGKTSDLSVPSRCPIFVPGDSPQLPFPSPILFGCGVDSVGETYGLVASDLGDLASLPGGGREIGAFFAFDRTVNEDPPTVASLDLDGPAPQVRAWAAPVAELGKPYCCPEMESDGVDRRIPVTVVAIGPSGMLLSVGRFDREPTEVALELTIWPPKAISWMVRFYVDGLPSFR